jgi:hypothetical protein
MTAYSDAEIAEAVANYAQIRMSPAHEIAAPYRSFAGFMRGGVEKFVSSADPWSAYRKRGEQDEKPDEVARSRREERKRKEREERIKELVDSCRFTREQAEAKVGT